MSSSRLTLKTNTNSKRPLVILFSQPLQQWDSPHGGPLVPSRLRPARIENNLSLLPRQNPLEQEPVAENCVNRDRAIRWVKRTRSAPISATDGPVAINTVFGH